LEYVDEVHDLFIALDCSGPSRLGDADELFRSARETLCIDHHINEGSFADHDFIFPEASSTCELVADTIDHDRITKEIAECIYTGMVTDTGVFQYECTHRSTMELAGELMEKGIDYPMIVDRVFFEKSFEQNKITGVALLNSKLYADGRILGSYVTREEMEKYNALPKHMEGIGSMLRSTKGVELAVLLYPLADGRIKGSSRSAKTFDCAAFASRHGGGGHVRAAGFSFDGGDIEKLLDEVCVEATAIMEDN
jgi:phosphoesterase RecJ-like protein